MSDDLDDRVAAAEAIATDPTQPPNLRAAARRAAEWVREYRDRPESRDELLDLRDTKYPAWLRDPDLFVRLSPAVNIDHESGIVAVRWDLIPKEDRSAAVSLLNDLVDAYRNRPTGGHRGPDLKPRRRPEK